MKREGADPVNTGVSRLCTNPGCSCESADGGCSPWCRAADRPGGERCRCGHGFCVPVLTRRMPSPGPGRAGWRAMAHARGAASPRWLVVVQRDRTALVPAARRRFDEPLCLVVLDRRQRDRRRDRSPVETERRRGERRQGLTPQEAGQWRRTGYRLVYRGAATWPRAARTASSGADVGHAGAEPLTVGAVMSPDPVTIGPEASLRQASEVMRRGGLHHLPVVGDGGRLIGIITDRDLSHAALVPVLANRMPSDARRLTAPRVRDAMTWRVQTTGPDATLVDAGHVMLERHIGSLPVVEGDRLVGILTEHDVLKALSPDIGPDSGDELDTDRVALAPRG
jgi:CBS domain-containing protein